MVARRAFSLNGRRFVLMAAILLLLSAHCLIFTLTSTKTTTTAFVSAAGFDLNSEPANDEEEFDEPDEQFQQQARSNLAHLHQLHGGGGGGGAGKGEGELIGSKPAGGGASWLSQIGARASGALKKTLDKLPEYFDFNVFQQQFKRKYSQAETLFRKSTFIQRCLAIFRARISARLGKASYLQGVNKFTDRSDNEIQRMYMSGPPREFRPAQADGQAEQAYLARLERLASERAEEDAMLPSQAASSSGQNSFSYLGGELGQQQQQQSSIISEAEARKEMETMLALDYSEADEDELERAIREELEGASVELPAQACEGACKRQLLPWPWRSGSKSSDRVDNWSLQLDLNDAPQLEQEEEGDSYKPPKLAGGSSDWLDWSEHQCFHTIYEQPDVCGMCYVMASTALAEFYKCAELEGRAKLRKFSKEFVFGCAEKFRPATVRGCAEGSALDTLRFMAVAGVYNIKRWRDKVKGERSLLQQKVGLFSELDLRCPLNQFEVPFEKWGEIKVEMNPVEVSPNEWFEALRDGPLVVSVQMPSEGVEAYASGVHDGQGCADSNKWHAMLLVGYGLNEHGIAFWNFRNSFGPNWGERGHFKMAMSVPGACLAGGVRLYREPAQLAE